MISKFKIDPNVNTGETFIPIKSTGFEYALNSSVLTIRRIGRNFRTCSRPVQKNNEWWMLYHTNSIGGIDIKPILPPMNENIIGALWKHSVFGSHYRPHMNDMTNYSKLLECITIHTTDYKLAATFAFRNVGRKDATSESVFNIIGYNNASDATTDHVTELFDIKDALEVIVAEHNIESINTSENFKREVLEKFYYNCRIGYTVENNYLMGTEYVRFIADSAKTIDTMSAISSQFKYLLGDDTPDGKGYISIYDGKHLECVVPLDMCTPLDTGRMVQVCLEYDSDSCRYVPVTLDKYLSVVNPF